MIKRILVTLSANRYTQTAIKHALELAQLHHAELIGVTDINERAVGQVGMVPIGAGASAHDLVDFRRRATAEHIQDAISSFEAACRDAAVPFSVHPERGEPFEQLTRLWCYCDLTVSGLQGLFEYDVIRSPKDVLIRLIAKGIRPIVAIAEEHRPIRNVLIAYNGSMESAETMKRFVQMRLWPDVQLKIVSFGFSPDEQDMLLNDAMDYCRAHEYAVEIEGSTESARHGLLAMCERSECDLIVMGSTARARIIKRILGDTAYHAIRHSSVPLFLAQ